jgi:hypothetical protein
MLAIEASDRFGLRDPPSDPNRCPTVFPWRSEHEVAGLARDALYLLRPDTYVALAETSGAPDALERYGSSMELLSLRRDRTLTA